MKLLTILLVFSGVYATSPALSFKRTDAIIQELGPCLSPEATIVLPGGNNTLSVDLTTRYSAVSHPDITAIVRVGAESDVAKIIKYANRKNRAFLAQSGRHGWAHTLNNAHDVIMIDISTLTTIKIDYVHNTMRVGGGVKIGNVMATLQAAGKETSTGICDCVGLLGATLGGGHGRMQGLHGLMLDNLLSVRLVTAAGEIINVSSTSYPDLFWGLRGAGHNFGVVVEAVYKVYEQTNGGLQFNANVMYSPDHIEALFTALNGFEIPAEMNFLFAFVPQESASPLIGLSFVSATSAEVATSVLEEVFGHIPYLSRTEGMVPWDKINGLGLLGKGKTACTGTDRRNPSGVSMKRYDIPTMLKAYSSFLNFTSVNPTTTATMMLFESYSVKGVQAVPAGDTAYPHREEKHIALLTASYLDAELDVVAQRWIDEITGILYAGSGFERPSVYVNYAQGTEGFGALYGYKKWRQRRLKGLKRKYDPGCVFGLYQPIPCS